jgi:hypothetical protein
MTIKVAMLELHGARRQDVHAAYSHLCWKGVTVEAPRVAPYGMKQLYVSDPDGYVICFQQPVPTPDPVRTG